MINAKPHFYGRRQGRKIRPVGQQALQEIFPSLALDLTVLPSFHDLRLLFPASVTKIWCEIGFGGGEHLAAQLEGNPTVGILGCEPFKNGMAHLLQILPPAHQERVRLFSEDVRLLLPLLPSQSIHRFYILFPDPWPKKRHHKRRLISKPFLDQLSRVLVKGGDLYLASDDPAYVETMFLLLSAHSQFQWRGGITEPAPETWPDWPTSWPLTRYGSKAMKQGKPCAHLIFGLKA